MAWNYSKKTEELFLEVIRGAPGTHMGEVRDADAFGECGSIACGDALRFTFRVERNSDPRKDAIVEIRYLTFGCTSAIASSEALCRIVEERNLTPVEALSVKNTDIVDYLGGLPEQKIHCSVLGADALEAAVVDWAKNRGVALADLGLGFSSADGQIVCECYSLTEAHIKSKIAELGLRTLEELAVATRAGAACASCREMEGGLRDLLNKAWEKEEGIDMAAVSNAAVADDTASNQSEGASQAISPYKLGKEVDRVVGDYIRPMLARDGGDIEVIDIKDFLVYCRLCGACAGCPGAAMTLKNMVEKTLRERVEERIKVVSV